MFKLLLKMCRKGSNFGICHFSRRQLSINNNCHQKGNLTSKMHKLNISIVTRSRFSANDPERNLVCVCAKIVGKVPCQK